LVTEQSCLGQWCLYLDWCNSLPRLHDYQAGWINFDLNLGHLSLCSQHYQDVAIAVTCAWHTDPTSKRIHQTSRNWAMGGLSISVFGSSPKISSATAAGEPTPNSSGIQAMPYGVIDTWGTHSIVYNPMFTLGARYPLYNQVTIGWECFWCENTEERCVERDSSVYWIQH
jgi:hypothetical protein